MALPLAAIFGFGTKILEKIFPDPTERAKAQATLLELEQKGELAELDASMQVILAEANSDSWLAKNWRPITMLTFVVVIANNYIIAPYAGALFGATAAISLPIPPDMWALLKLGLGGYVLGRSGEKIAKVWKEK